MSSGNDTYTKILLHFNGSDAGTTITDDNAGGSAHTWTAAGNANTDTAIKQFGTAALLCDGSGDYVTTPDHADFTLGSSDWTVDCWFYVNGGTGTTRRMFGQAASSNNPTTISIIGGLDTANKITVSIFDATTFGTLVSSSTFTAVGWHHMACVRTGNTVKLFIDGIQEGADLSCTVPLNDSSAAWAVGRRGEVTANTWNGLIDEFRLSVGIARWTSNFTPESTEYSASAIITAALVTNTSSAFASVTTSTYPITGVLATDADTFFVAAVATPSSQSITGGKVTDADTFFASLIDVAAIQSITAAIVENVNLFRRATIAQAAAPSTDIRNLYHHLSGSKIAFWRAVESARIRGI